MTDEALDVERQAVILGTEEALRALSQRGPSEGEFHRAVENI
jgi:hypothetical protein